MILPLFFFVFEDLCDVKDSTAPEHTTHPTMIHRAFRVELLLLYAPSRAPGLSSLGPKVDFYLGQLRHGRGRRTKI